MPSVTFEKSGTQGQNVEVNTGTTVGKLAQDQGMDPRTLDILVDGQRADIDRVLSGGEVVFVAPQVEASAPAPAAAATTETDRMNVVRVGKFPGKPQDLEVSPGASVREVLEAANLDPSGFDVRRNGQPVDLDAVVQDGDAIALYRPVQGNEQTSDIAHELVVRVAAA